MNAVAALACMFYVAIGIRGIDAKFYSSATSYSAGNDAAFFGCIAIGIGLLAFLYFAGTALGIRIERTIRKKPSRVASVFFAFVAALIPLSFIADGIAIYLQRPLLRVGYATAQDARIQGICMILVGVAFVGWVVPLAISVWLDLRKCNAELAEWQKSQLTSED